MNESSKNAKTASGRPEAGRYVPQAENKQHGTTTAKPGATKADTKKLAGKTSATKDPASPPQPDLQVEFKRLIDLANKGDRDAISRLRRFLDANPSIWKRAGDLSALAESSWLELIAGSDKLMDESVKRQLHAMKGELAGPHPTELERLLIQQVATTWLAMTHAEMLAANPASASLGQANFRLKYVESAQRRHLNAMKMLATMRLLLSRGLVPSNPLKLFDPDKRIG